MSGAILAKGVAKGVAKQRIATTVWNVVRYARWFVRQLVEQFVGQGCLKSAAALTYTTLFAIVPMMTVGYRVMSLLPDLSDVGVQIQMFIFDNFVPESSLIVQERLREFSDQARQLTLVGAVFLGVTAFMMLVTMESSFNQIWQVAQRRRGLQRFMTYWAVLTFGPPLIGAGFLVSTYLFSLPLLVDMDTSGFRETLLSYLPAILSAAAFTMMYYAIPNCRVPFRHAVLGGLVAMLGLELCKSAFAFTVENSNMTLIYGTFAAVPLFLTWLYVAWAVVLSGAIVVRTLSLEREPEGAVNEPPLVGAVRVLGMLRHAHAEGRAANEIDIVGEFKLRRVDRDRIFAVLHELKLIHQTQTGALVLGRSLQHVTLWSLFERLPDGLPETPGLGIPGLPGLSKAVDEFIADSSKRLDVSLEQVLDATGSDASTEPGQGV